MGVCTTDDKKIKVRKIPQDQSTNPKEDENSKNEINKNNDLKNSKNSLTNSNAVKNPQDETSIKNENNKPSMNQINNNSEIINDKAEENKKIDLTKPVIGTPKEIEIIPHSINYGIIGDNEKSNENKDSNLLHQPNPKNDESQNSEKKQENNINNTNNISLNNNYENFKNDKDYYLICPECNRYITNVEKAEYDSENKDMKIKYKCSCEEGNEKFLYSIIKEEKPKCKEHIDNEIKYICENCSKQICEECRTKEHNDHQVKNIINNKVISDSINNTVSEQKENFKGFDVFSKIFEFYNKTPEIKEIDEKKQSIENQNESQKNFGDDEKKYDYNYKISEQRKENNEEEITKKSNNNDEVRNSFAKGDYMEKMQEQKDEINDNIQKDLEKNNSNNKINDIIESNDNMNQNEINKVNSIKQIITDENIKLDEEKPQVRPPNDINEQEKEKEEKMLLINKFEKIDIKVNSGIKEIDNEQNLLKEGRKDDKDINNSKVLLNKSNNEFNIGIKNENDINNSDEKDKITKNKIADIVEDKIKEHKDNPEEKVDNIIDDGIGGKKIDDLNEDQNNMVEENNFEDNNNNKNINENNNNNDSNIDIPTENILKPLKNYTNTKTLIGHQDRVVSLIRLNSGYIATGSYDYSIKIWDITKEPKDSLISVKSSDGFIFCLLELKPNELLSGNSKNVIDVYDLNDTTDEIVQRLFEHTLWISALVKCDENNFASASNDARIVIWDSNSKKKLRELIGHTDCILTMILLEDGRLCSGSADNNIIIWDWKNEKYLSRFKAHNSWVKIICQFNEQFLLSGSDDKKIKIWNMDLVQVDEFVGHGHSVRTLCKIDDNHFASGSFDTNINIWDFNERKCINSLKGHQSNVICIIKYDDKLISCSNDSTIKIWEEV